MGIESPIFTEGRTFPAQYRENGEAVCWRLVRMMQRGVLIGFNNPESTLEDRTLQFIDRFGDQVDRFPRVVHLLLDSSEKIEGGSNNKETR